MRLSKTDLVVIKELSISNLENWKNKELFEREIAVLNSLNHKQIPNLIDNFELGDGSDKCHYLVMEYIEGVNLEEEISKKRYTENEVLELIEELLNILDYLHSFSPPIVHRDIMPSNIICRKVDNKLVLIDFGAVTEALKVEGGSTVVGTYGYMAPEQFMGQASVQSDYYSLGAIMIKLLIVWFIVSFGCGILFVEELNTFKLGGYKLGFWFAQQGSIYSFVILTFVYAKLMATLDRKYGVDDE